MAPLRGVSGWFTLRCARPRTGVQYGVGLRAMRGPNLECVLYGGGRGFHADYFAGTNGAVDLSNCKWEESCHLRCSTQRWNVSKLWCDGVRTSPAIAEDGTTRCSTESLTFDSLAGGCLPRLSLIAICVEADRRRNICDGVNAIRARGLWDGDVRRPDLGLIGYGHRFVLQHLVGQNQHSWEE